MQRPNEEIQLLAEDFRRSRRTLLALGDENRQHLILTMMQMGRCGGVRVGEIAAHSHLSRPAVSHHLRILKEAGVVAVRREGTRNYYYFDAGSGTLNALDDMLQHAHRLMQYLAEQGAAAEPTER